MQRSRKHNRAVKKITKESIARRELRRAIKEGKEDDIIKDIARKFHKMIRLHSRAKKEQLKARLNLEAGKARLECARNLWRYAAKILDGEEDLIEPSFSVKDAEEFFKKVYSRPPSKFQRPQWLPPMNRPQVAFDDSAITLSEVAEVIRRTKNSSSPSPMDRVGYQIFKRCPGLLTALVDIYNSCWDLQTVPLAWKQAVIKLIPKERAKSNPAEPSNFCPIALTSCVGKVFTSILKNRWLHYMIANQYLDTNTQKAFVRSVPGCTEQYRKLLGAITEAFKKHKSISVCWLDLALTAVLIMVLLTSHCNTSTQLLGLEAY